MEAAYVWDGGFVWCGGESRTPATSIAELEAPRREEFWVYDDEKGDLVGGAAGEFLASLVSTGVSEPTRLTIFYSPSGEQETMQSGDPLNLDRPDEPRDPAPLGRSVDLPRQGIRSDRQIPPPSILVSGECPEGVTWGVCELPSSGQLPGCRCRALDPSLNFLSAEADAHAVEREAVVKSEQGALDPVRFRRNMLSSMPMCFNLFGTMRAEPDFLAFSRSSSTRRDRDPGHHLRMGATASIEYLGDRTAFDAIVFYETPTGPPRFGIETKYTEPFTATEYESPRYEKVTGPSLAGSRTRWPRAMRSGAAPRISCGWKS